MVEDDRERFFWWMGERLDIYNKRANQEPWPWTESKIMKQFKFTNVFRELDRTTLWYRNHVREPLHNNDEVVFATVLFRWFNRIETGERINEIQGFTDYDPNIIDAHVRPHTPWVTGAYIIKTPDGMDKLRGVLHVATKVWNDRETLVRRLKETPTLRQAHSILGGYQYLGDFMAYELVSDLRHTHILNDCNDIQTWANPGPGAMRGAKRSRGMNLQDRLSRVDCIKHMISLVEESNTKTWLLDKAQPSWEDIGNGVHHFEARDIEHSLCEFDKYERVRRGEGRPRGQFHWRGY